MADTKKIVEALAKEAGLNAKGARPCCQCGTYQEVVAEAESLIEDIARKFCPDMTFAILMVAASRYKCVAAHSMGVLPMVEFLAEMADQSNDLGLQIKELLNATSEWHDQLNPHKEGS